MGARDVQQLPRSWFKDNDMKATQCINCTFEQVLLKEPLAVNIRLQLYQADLRCECVSV